MSFETQGGILFEVREGKPPLKISSNFEIDRVVTDSTRTLWAVDVWALDIDNQLVKFRIEPRDFFGICTTGIEQKFAAHALYVWNAAALVRYLRGNIPALKPVVVKDLRVRDDDDFREGSNRRFRAAFEKNSGLTEVAPEKGSEC